ncbi:MAG: MFS transporter [Bacteroidales bacterium]|nr:MFS transporter [Bacteroidales bacterium]
MKNRTRFPKVFWVANTIEIFERFAYYGIYMGFGIYFTEQLGYSDEELGNIQSWFLLVSYLIPFLSGTFADKYGFKKVLIVSYLAYLPAVISLMFAETYSGVAFAMISIGFAAGIFKPLISATVRAVTDQTNKTVGFGIFYLMVNAGASIGPVIAGKLRVISWKYSFLAGAIAIGCMLVITLFFYKEPKREIEGVTLKKKFQDIWVAISDLKFAFFLIILGLFFWTPFWAFFNLLPKYVNGNLDTVELYNSVKKVLGGFFIRVISKTDENGVGRILGETISHSGYIIIIFQFFVSKFTEKFKPIPTFLWGMVIAAFGFMLLAYARVSVTSIVFLGIFLFAIGEMVSSPRIQEYITWLAPKEKAGLYMGANFLAIGIGGFVSGYYTRLFGVVKDKYLHPEYIWYVLAAHIIVGFLVIFLFTKMVGDFKEREE